MDSTNRSRFLLVVATGLVAASLAGCVTRGSYQELEADRDAAVGAVCERLMAEDDELAERVLRELLDENSFYKGYITRGATPFENYRDRPILTAPINHRLLAEYADRFTPIQRKYRKRLEELEQKIAVREAE